MHLRYIDYFRDRRILLTGGSSGIGRCLAVRLAEAGASVFLLARRPGPLDETVADLESSRRSPGQVFRAEPVDVGDRRAVEAAIARLLGEFDVDVLINNAGIAHADSLDRTDAEVFEAMMRTNYFGTVWPTRALVPHFRARGRGHVANVASLVGVLGFYGYAAYAPSKFAVMGFSDVIRNELRDCGVRVTVLLPPDTDTPQLAEENRTKPAQTRAINGTVRTMAPDDVALALLKGMAAGRYHVVPGRDGKIPYYATRWFPGLVRWVIDRQARSCRVDGPLEALP
jgi:3-dehydrosphinganine reductase